MKHHLLIWLLTLCSTFGAHAQQPTYVMNGKTYYVYPYQLEMEINQRNFRMGVEKEEILHRDSLNRAIISSEVQDVKRYYKMRRGKSFRKHKKTFLELRRTNPGYLIDFDLSLEEDLTPTLEPLPDGEYVQFYRDIPYVDAHNVLRYHNDMVAAVFTLKNNQLNGFACWMTPMGDTLKAGRFVDGLKEGRWFKRSYEYSTMGAKKSDIRPESFMNGTFADTSYFIVDYKTGLRHGTFIKGYNDFISMAGHYSNGEESGEWFEYGYKTVREGYKTIYTDDVIVLKHYFIPEKETPAKSVIVRNLIIDRSRINRTENNVFSMSEFEPFSEFYELYEPKEEEGLELPEEKVRSYPGEEEDEMLFSEEGRGLKNIDFSYAGAKRTYGFNEKDYSRNDLIDSVGYVFKFDKVYEEYYRNGQLKIRFEIRDGKLVSEDTVFWDNGQAANIIHHLADSNQYEEKTFDYDGVPLYHLLYDSRGNFLRDMQPKPDNSKHVIRGNVYTAGKNDVLFERNTWDTVKYNLTAPVVLFESLWCYDTTLAIVTKFDPTTRSYESASYSLTKKPVYQVNGQFGEDYDNVNATENYRVGKLNAQTLMNGAYVKNNPRLSRIYAIDTVPNSKVRNWMRSFDLQTDYTLYYEETPFTGKFTMNMHEHKFNLKASGKTIHIDYANGSKHERQIQKAFDAVRKGKHPELASYLTYAGVSNNEISRGLLYNLIPFSGSIVEIPSDRFFRVSAETGYETRNNNSEKKARSFDKTVEGQFLNGKPEGVWITRDQFGQITAEVPFVNGEIDGEVRYYEIAYPEKKPKNNRYVYKSYMASLLKDSLPEKPTHYLSRTCHYKQGVLNGTYVEMDWKKDTLSKVNYVDGHASGTSMERNKIAYTVSNYEFGDRDGISRTYLTLPGRDTVILFDLNYQNGYLQGESKSYHLNGKLAKHGFFLSGQPIDDYESFDTLGFRYQYVKFQYGQPIEEKIWEANQLSVRYEFDWRDSIPFYSRDIAGSTSLDRLLSQLGLNDRQNREPYLGRPSLVNKTGIEYILTKYYPNDTVARHGTVTAGKKTGCWEFYSYDGVKLYEVDYYDTILQINDSVRFKSKGILTLLDAHQQPICRSWIVEKIEKYDCSHTDHHEIRMLYTFWERDTSEHRINGYVKNYYDNGVLMNEGRMQNGLATGVWKFYDPYGNLHMVGEYILGKRNGRWLSGDLSQVKYMGDICLNPNLPNLEEIMSYQEKLLDISVIYYQMTKVKKREYYGVNLNASGPPEGYEDEEMYIDEEMIEIEYEE